MYHLGTLGDWRALCGHDISDWDFWKRRGFTDADLEEASQHAQVIDESLQVVCSEGEGPPPFEGMDIPVPEENGGGGSAGGRGGVSRAGFSSSSLSPTWILIGGGGLIALLLLMRR